MVRRARLDRELVRRGMARSRDHAGELIAQGRVRIAGAPAVKAATAVAPDTPVVVEPPADAAAYVSRGGHKLAGALAEFGLADPPLEVRGRRCLDAGASTGGFTDVLLRAGARHVVAVDVGYGQIHWSLRTDSRVTVIERTNVRNLNPADVGGSVSLTVADLSFISLRTVLPALIGCTDPDGELVLLVKPQFEVGRALLGSGGVVRDPVLRAGAVEAVAAHAREQGLAVRGVVASALPGPSGNVEYLLWLAGPAAAGGAGDTAPALAAAVRRAVEEGPA